MQMKAGMDKGRIMMMHRIWQYISFIILFSFIIGIFFPETIKSSTVFSLIDKEPEG